MIRHIVMLNFKDGFTPKENEENALQVKQKLEALAGVVPGIINFTVYIDALSGANKNLCMYTLFESVEALAAYQIHPAHVAASNFVGTMVCGRACADFIEA